MGIITAPQFLAGLGSGTGEALMASPGTGLSGPPGLESVLEFNGLFLNNRDDIDTYILSSIDGLGDADVRDAREVNPAQHGETAFDAYYGGRTIVLTGKIRAHNPWKLRDMQQALRQTFADLSVERPLIFHEVPGVDVALPETSPPTMRTSVRELQINVKKSQPIVMGEVQNNFNWERDFQITLRASNPRFLSILPTSVAITIAEISKVAVNNGNFDAQPIVTFTGPLTNAVLMNDTTGKAIRLTGTIAAGNTATIDVGKRTMIDQAGANAFSLLSLTSDWMELAPGNNTLSITATGTTGASSVAVTYRHTTM